MTKNYQGEKWKEVKFDFEFTNDYRVEVSNFGRIRTFHKFSDGNILKGSMINGYRIIRLKFYKPRETKMQKSLDFLQTQLTLVKQKITALSKQPGTEKQVKEMKELLKNSQKNLTQKFHDDQKKRTIHYHALVHRLVAEYFLKKSSEAHTVVAHNDYDKLNNNSCNLQWMTQKENMAHQQLSPYVIEKRKDRKFKRSANSKVNKLTVTKVMLLKKLLNEGKPIRTLVKHFKVSDTQILRIKRGENWGDIEAAS